jgi:DNA-binding GntR family transcriptional regulator
MIISGELRPGERLLQNALAKRFGVSQSVMREALLEAQFSGLVVSANGAGASVAAIDVNQVMKAYAVREMLEGLAARSCCQQAAPAHLRELTETAHKIHALGLAGDDKARASLDRKFHERIISVCDNEVVQRLSEGYHVVRLAVLKVVPHDQILADHLAIVDAIKANDEEGAEQAARRHVVSAREMIRRQLEARDMAFPWERTTSGQ